jgi:hypothetical protein
MTGKVLRVIPFEDFKTEFADYGRTELMDWMSYYEKWEEAVQNHTWLFASETDFIIETTCSHDKAHQFFTRTADGGWFSFDTDHYMMGARMDVDHEYEEEYESVEGELALVLALSRPCDVEK